MLNSSQNIVASYTYDPFGKRMSKTGTLDQPYMFSTKEYDEQTGLSYYGYRFYNTSTGKWTTRDPIGEAGGVNLYGFVGNDPVNWVDPLGLKTWMCEKPLDKLCEWGAECSGTKNFSDTSWNPLYHQYICVGNEDAPICGGQRSGGKLYGPGKQSNDKYNPDKCKEKDPDNDCLESCIQKKIQDPKRPYYGLIGPGMNCHEWADKTYADCVRGCQSRGK